VLYHDRRVWYMRPGLCLHRPLHLRVLVQLLVSLTARRRVPIRFFLYPSLPLVALSRPPHARRRVSPAGSEFEL